MTATRYRTRRPRVVVGPGAVVEFPDAPADGNGFAYAYFNNVDLAGERRLPIVDTIDELDSDHGYDLPVTCWVRHVGLHVMATPGQWTLRYSLTGGTGQGERARTTPASTTAPATGMPAPVTVAPVVEYFPDHEPVDEYDSYSTVASDFDDMD